jgi:D-alanyl-D-alanine carboxypeptidase (penicillin-binding protein 5/6)
MLRKILIWMLTAFLVISILPLFAFAAEEPVLRSRGVLLMDMQSGQVLYGKNENERFYPASITKIMTAILALEHSSPHDQVKVSRLAMEQEGNRVYLVDGEVQSMENLLYGLMLNSGNDAAVAIAEHISGSVESFAELMNEKAKELGAKNTHFVNPNGLHDPNHYTTPYDITLIARYAMNHPKFREIVKTETLPWHGKEWESVLYNINPMLYNYEGANGVKTGYTDQARQTMVVSASRDGRVLIGTLMEADLKQTIREDAAALLDYGFNQFATKQLAERNQVVTTLSFDKKLSTDVIIAFDWYYSFAKSQGPSIQSQIHLNPAAQPPLAAGTAVGTLEFTADGKKIGSVPLLTAKDVAAPPGFLGIGISKLFIWWYLLIPLPFLLFGFLVVRSKVRAANQMRVQNFRDYQNQNYY